MNAGYNPQGQYVDAQGNPAPNPADAAPGISQGIANLLGTSFTPGRETSLPHETQIDPVHAPQALESGKSGWGTYMPQVQIGTGMPTRETGIQTGTLQEDIDQEAGGVGDVWDNVNLGASDPEGYYPSLEGASIEGDPSGAPPKMVNRLPPVKPTPPQTEFPYIDPTSQNPIDELVTADPQALARNVMDTSAPDVTATMTPEDAAAYNRGLQGVDTYLSGQAPNLDLPANNPGNRLMAWLAELMGKDVDTDMAPSESPVPTAAETARQGAGANTVPATGDDAGDLRGERRPMNEREYMDNAVPQVPTRGTAPRVSPRTGGRDVRRPGQTTTTPPVRPTTPTNETPSVIGADSPILQSIMNMFNRPAPPAAAAPQANTNDLMKRYMGAVGG